MSSILIVGDETNAITTAIAWGARGHRCSILDRPEQHFDAFVFGEEASVILHEHYRPIEGSDTIAVVYAEGESVADGFRRVAELADPRLVLVMGGGAAGIVEAREAARLHGIDPGTVLVTSAFIFGGDLGASPTVTSEKQRLISGFLGESSAETEALALQLAPTIELNPVLVVALSSINALIHPATMVLNAVNIERQERIRFYVEAYAEAVVDVVLTIDAERLELGRSLGIDLVSFELMLDRYYGEQGMSGATVHEKITTFRGYGKLLIPETLHHRFLEHEIVTTIAPMREMMRARGLSCSATDALITFSEILTGSPLSAGAGEVSAGLLTYS